MKSFRIDNIDLTVNSLEQTKKFYTDLFVNYLGWQVYYDSEDYFMVGQKPGLRIGFSLSNPEFANNIFNRYRIGQHHFAIEFSSKLEIDSIYDRLLDLKANILDKPAKYDNYSDYYYSVFFEDPNGFKLEFVTYHE